MFFLYQARKHLLRQVALAGVTISLVSVLLYPHQSYALDIALSIDEGHSSPEAGETLSFVVDVKNPDNKKREVLTFTTVLLQGGDEIARQTSVHSVETSAQFIETLRTPPSLKNEPATLRITVSDTSGNRDEVGTVVYATNKNTSGKRYIALGLTLATIAILLSIQTTLISRKIRALQLAKITIKT